MLKASESSKAEESDKEIDDDNLMDEVWEGLDGLLSIIAFLFNFSIKRLF